MHPPRLEVARATLWRIIINCFLGQCFIGVCYPYFARKLGTVFERRKSRRFFRDCLLFIFNLPASSPKLIQGPNLRTYSLEFIKPLTSVL